MKQFRSLGRSIGVAGAALFLVAGAAFATTVATPRDDSASGVLTSAPAGATTIGQTDPQTGSAIVHSEFAGMGDHVAASG